MPFLVVIGILLFWLLNSLRILKEYERGVIFRLGRVLAQPQGPGFVFVFFPIDQIVVVSMRTVTMDIPPQDIITKDNVSVKVNAVVYFRVIDPIKALIQVQDFQFATSQMAQTTLRSILGEMELDDLLSQREKINAQLQTILDQQTEPWGIKVASVAVKDVDLSDELRRAMARQAEAERERRAKIIAAEGEFQAAEKITAAAELMQKQPAAIQLRYLQTLVEIGKVNNTTTIFPIPIDLLRAWTEQAKK